MLKLILILVCVLSEPLTAKPVDSVLAHIIRLRPSVNRDYAARLATQVTQLGKQFHVSPRIIVAIAMQESSLDPANHRRDKAGRITDYGLMQVNVHSIKAYHLDQDLISWSEDYQIYAGVMILAGKLKDCAGVYPESAWACYHSQTVDLHYEYVRDVARWL